MNKNSVKLEGFFHIQIVEDIDGEPSVIGDSGWQKNTITNTGIRDYIVTNLLGGVGKSVSFMAVGTGGAPAVTDVALAGELTQASNARKAVSTSIIASKTAQFTAAFASSASFVTTTVNISNVGLFETSTTAGGSLFAGNTYTSSSLATNQNINVSYEIRFS